MVSTAQKVETDRPVPVCRRKDDRILDARFGDGFLHDLVDQIAMRIEHAHTHAQGNRLAHHTLDQGRFPGPSFSNDVEVIAEILPPHAERLQHNLSGMVDMADPELYVETLLLHNACRVRPP